MQTSSGPLTEALETLWQQSRFRLYTPRHLWSWFVLHQRFELRFLRTGQLSVEVPRGLVPDCENCVEICCTGKNAVVSLRLSDIARLMDAGLDAYIDRRPRLPLASSSWAGREVQWSVFHDWFPVLRRDATGTCTLLREDRSCGAWPSWPLSCARYPYALDALRHRVFLAKGCGSHRLMNVDDAPDKIRQLVDAAVRGYNERIRDVVLLHVALKELHALGLTRHLRLRGHLARRLQRLHTQRTRRATDA